MKGRERPCSIRRQLRSSQNVLQRSVEPAAQSGHRYCSDGRTDESRARLSIASPEWPACRADDARCPCGSRCRSSRR
jgi:hypothetical protein